MKALVIGRGVQGKRWINNLERLGYSIEAYGRDYKEKLQRNQYYDIIILAVPHNAFLEVTEELRKRGIQSKKIIIEKPGARNLREYLRILENLYYIGYSEMFLPLYIEYGFISPRSVIYIGKLEKQLIKYVDTNEEIIKLVNGRTIDLNILRDLYWHPASLYRYPYFNLEMKIIKDEMYQKFILRNREASILLGRDPKEARREINGREVKFTNPMQKQIKRDYETLAVDKLPLSIWNALNRLLNQ